jgi:hypothetical protein
MTDQHPIAPSLELVQQWTDEIYGGPGVVAASDDICLAKLAAQWGADQELEACIDVLSDQWQWDMLSQCTGWKEFRDKSEKILRTARRSKPPTLTSIALQMLDTIERDAHYLPEITDTIRRALEALPDD